MNLTSRIDVLDAREQEQIKQTVLTMLHEVGIFVECPDVVASLKRHGYRMDGQRLKPTPEETLAFLDRYAHAPTRQATIPRDTIRPATAHVLGLADVSILDWETKTNYGSGKSESKWWDVQDGFEKMLNRVFPLLAGLGWGALGEMATNEYFSFEQALLDLKMIAMGNRMIEGVRVDDTTLDVEVFREGVAAGLFAGLEHTVEHYRAELYLPHLASRESYTQWDAAGRRTIEERAHARVEDIIRTAEPHPKYPPDVQRDLEKLLVKFQRDFK